MASIKSSFLTFQVGYGQFRADCRRTFASFLLRAEGGGAPLGTLRARLLSGVGRVIHPRSFGRVGFGTFDGPDLSHQPNRGLDIDLAGDADPPRGLETTNDGDLLHQPWRDGLLDQPEHKVAVRGDLQPQKPTLGFQPLTPGRGDDSTRTWMTQFRLDAGQSGVSESRHVVPNFIERGRDTEFESCPFGRVGERGLTRAFAGCAASGQFTRYLQLCTDCALTLDRGFFDLGRHAATKPIMPLARITHPPPLI